MRAILMQHESRIVSRAGLPQPPRTPFELRVKQSHKPVARHVPAQQRVQSSAQIIGTQQHRRQSAHRRLQVRHQQRRRQPFPHHVRDAQPESFPLERQHIEIISADDSPRFPGPPDFLTPPLRNFLRQKPSLHPPAPAYLSPASPQNPPRRAASLPPQSPPSPIRSSPQSAARLPSFSVARADPILRGRKWCRARNSNPSAANQTRRASAPPANPKETPPFPWCTRALSAAGAAHARRPAGRRQSEFATAWSSLPRKPPTPMLTCCRFLFPARWAGPRVPDVVYMGSRGASRVAAGTM